MALSAAHPAAAQTSAVVHLAVQSGNGQVMCLLPSCTLQGFQPISVKATDANGNPVGGATVTWTLTSGTMNLTSGATTVTAGNGIATQNIVDPSLITIASPGVAFLTATIQASSNNSTAVFTETHSLNVENQQATEIVALAPTYNGSNLTQANFSVPAGARLSTPILVQVNSQEYNFGNTTGSGVPNVAVRIINAQSSPTVSCDSSGGGYADPGSVLTNAQGLASCFPIFTGSGTGQFYVSVGGTPSNDITTADYLQEFPLYTAGSTTGYTFTSNPGPATTVQIISGNNQVGNFGQTLDPLVARLVDANGNAVQNATITWTVTPAGALALTQTTTVTDNNGQVSTLATLFLPASAGATVVVALKSNPNVSATFQETVPSAVSALNKVSGDNQSAQQGANFAQPLVVQVVSSAGPVVNFPVQFQTTGPVSLPGGTNIATVGTNAAGNASITVTAGGQTGTGTVTAVAGALSKSFTLTVTPTQTTPPPSQLVIVLGNNQTVVEGGGFSPLTVQVNSTAGAVSGATVGFSVSGPASLSSGAAVTNSSGQATVNVTAGNTPGAVTVTATINGLSQTFNLTVTAPGLTITSSSFLNAASRQVGFLSPCSLAILTAPGLLPNGNAGLMPAPIFGRYPKSAKGLSVTFNGIAAPIVSVANGATNPEVTLQVPCEVAPGNSVAVIVTTNGGGTGQTTIPVLAVSPGIFTSVQSDGVARAVVVRQDGSFADIGGSTTYDPNNPVRHNENVIFYLTGLGTTIPTVNTDSIENPLAYVDLIEAVVQGTMQAAFVGGSGLNVVSARQAPNLIGVYEVQVAIPSSAPTGNSVPISICIVPANSPASTPGVCPSVNPIVAIQ